MIGSLADVPEQTSIRQIEIEVTVVRLTSRGEVWLVVLPDGSTLESRTPFFAAARALLAGGVDPAAPLVMRHRGSATVALRSTVGRAARWTVAEEPRPKFVRYEEHPDPAEGPPAGSGNAKSWPSRRRPTADTRVPLSHVQERPNDDGRRVPASGLSEVQEPAPETPAGTVVEAP